MMIYKNLNIYYHLKESMNTMSTQENLIRLQ